MSPSLAGRARRRARVGADLPRAASVPRPRILVVAEGVRARARLAAALAADAEVVVAPPERAQSPARAVDEARPDLVLVAAAGRDVPRLVRAMARAPSAPPVVLLIDEPGRAWRMLALRGAVQGVLPHDASAAEISAAVRAALAGLVVVHRAALGTGGRTRSGTALGRRPEPCALTPREAEILGMMAEGLGNKAIAARLGISGHTAKFHVAAILEKLHAGSRAHAVALGLGQGLILI